MVRTLHSALTSTFRALLVVLTLGMSVASANVVPALTSNNIMLTLPASCGTSIAVGACENTDVILLTEKQDYTLLSPVHINIWGTPGTYNSTAQEFADDAHSLPMGTVLNSYYVHFDPVINSGANNPANDTLLGLAAGWARVVFQEDILALQTLNTTLNELSPPWNSRQLRISGLTYSTSSGLELGASGNTDVIIIDPRTVEFRLTATGATADDFRILTSSNVPEPVTMVLLGTGLIGLGIAGNRLRRKSRTA